MARDTRTARKIWIKYNGPIPKDWEGRSYQIHHIDGDHQNDVIENFRCVSIREHYDIHWFQEDYGACFMIARDMKLTVFEMSSLAKLTSKKKIENGTHHVLTKEWSLLATKTNLDRVKNGTHPTSPGGSTWKMFQDGTHPFVGEKGSKRAREHCLLLVKEGRHPSQKEYTCPYCGITGKGGVMNRWHFDNCKYKESGIS